MPVPTVNRSQFKRWLRAYRTERRLTQEEVADLLGVAPRTVSQWERGKQLPSTIGAIVALLEGAQVQSVPDSDSSVTDRVNTPNTPVSCTSVSDRGNAVDDNSTESAEGALRSPDLKFG